MDFDVRSIVVVLMVSAASLIACGPQEPETEEDEPTVTISEKPSIEERFEDIEANQEGKSDDIDDCGADRCSVSLCGWDCTRAGEYCEKACAEESNRQRTYVQVMASGTHEMMVDSRDYEYVPHVSESDVVVYGCQPYGWETASYEVPHHIAVSYREFGDAFEALIDVEFILEEFQGPGSYPGRVTFVPEGDASPADDVYTSAEDGCGFEVESTDQGGIEGTAVCFDVPRAGDLADRADIQARFRCSRLSLNNEEFVLREEVADGE